MTNRSKTTELAVILFRVYEGIELEWRLIDATNEEYQYQAFLNDAPYLPSCMGQQVRNVLGSYKWLMTLDEPQTTVANLATLEEKTFRLPPTEAIKVAFVSNNPDAEIPPITCGQLTIACGDWCAKF